MARYITSNQMRFNTGILISVVMHAHLVHQTKKVGPGQIRNSRVYDSTTREKVNSVQHKTSDHHCLYFDRRFLNSDPCTDNLQFLANPVTSPF